MEPDNSKNYPKGNAIDILILNWRPVYPQHFAKYSTDNSMTSHGNNARFFP